MKLGCFRDGKVFAKWKQTFTLENKLGENVVSIHL